MKSALHSWNVNKLDMLGRPVYVLKWAKLVECCV